MNTDSRAWLLVPWAIRLVVPERSIGVYLLGSVSLASSAFCPAYVGRSDIDLRRRLLRHGTTPLDTYFRVRRCASRQAAFFAECFLFHALRGTPQLRNALHPAAPDGSGLDCPYCFVALPWNIARDVSWIS